MKMMRITQFILIFLLTICQSVAYAHKDHMPASVDGLFVSVTFDLHGALWRASTKDGFVLVDKSVDMGKTFTKPVKVNTEAQNIASGNESRPKIATDARDSVYVSWTQNLKTLYAANIWFARSLDSGKSFEMPYIVHQNRADVIHAFNALNVTPSGNITVLWVDGRDAATAKLVGKPYAGLAIYYALSSNAGKSFSPEQKLADYSCECCRIATTNKPDGTVVAMWRHIFEGGERDHMIAEVPNAPQNNSKTDLHRATFGHWKIDGCPHQGAAIASGGEGKDWWGYHMAYFDGHDANPGLYYSRMDGVAWASSPAKKFGNNANQAGRPAILSVGENVWLVWREIEAKNYKIVGMFSDDGGKSWNDAKVLASTSDKADYPQLLTKDSKIYFVWNTLKDGIKVMQLI